VDTLLGPLMEAKTPFSSTHGNHDNHKNISHLDEILREGEVAGASGLSYTRRAPAGIGGEGGEGNYWVPVFADDTGGYSGLS
jgi:DNA repair exonuclease SbcCD nuclease subunit